MPRFRIKALVAFVAVIAAGLGAMRVASDTLEDLVRSALIMVLLVGLTGGLTRRDGGWIGFAAFLWGYFLIGSITSGDKELTGQMIESIADRLHPCDFPRPPKPKLDPKFLKTLDFVSDARLVESGFDPDVSSLTDVERQNLETYRSQLRPVIEKERAANHRKANAEVIGTDFLGVAFGCVGSIVGRFLEKRPAW